MKRISLLFLALLPGLHIGQLAAQQAPDFAVTDVSGADHQLYDDYLNEGQAVVLGLFYIGAPMLEDMYPQLQDYADLVAAQDLPVNFLLLSAFDDDSDLVSFAEAHDISIPAVSFEGGATEAIAPYTGDNAFGTFYGYPMFVVIGPDGTVIYDPWAGDVDGVIEAVGEAVNDVLSSVNVAEAIGSEALRITRSRDGVHFSHPAFLRGAELRLYTPDGRLFREITASQEDLFISLEPRELLIYLIEGDGFTERGRLPLLQ